MSTDSAESSPQIGSPDYEAQGRNPPPPQELEENVEASSGDSIGQTAFSKHWLFTALMKLIKVVEKKNDYTTAGDEPDGGTPSDNDKHLVDIDDDLQNELCKLWDMSMNNEVAQFLHEFKAIDILTEVIDKSKAPRVTEICVGILGNMACDNNICLAMVENEKLVKMTLLLLKDPDPPTLAEITRLLYTSLSNKEASKIWIEAINNDDEVRIDLQFILQSSTNSDLLKNTTELVDVLMDRDEDLCVKWAEEDLVISLLEAIKQVGYKHSATLEPYLHIFQLLSTNETGVEALVSCSKGILKPLLHYLHGICQDEIVGLEGHESCLASAISVLTVLFSSSSSTADSLLSSCDLIRCLLKVLDPLYPLMRDNLPEDDINTSADNNERETTNNNNNTENGRSRENSNRILEETPETIELIRKQKILFTILQGFLCDIISYIHDYVPQVLNNKTEELVNIESTGTENSETLPQENNKTSHKDSHKTRNTPRFLATLDYLDESCSRERIYKMLYSVKDSGNSEILEEISTKYSKSRLDRLLRSFKDGRRYSRSESHPSKTE